MKTIHIIPSNHHQDLREFLLESQDYLSNVELLDFNIAFKIDQNKDELIIKSFEILNKLELKILKDVIKFPKTTELIISMAKELKLYQIDVNDLPSETDLDLDIKLCLQTLDKLIDSPLILENHQYIAYNHGLSHAQHSFLEANNIKIKDLPEVSPHSIHFHNALNPRQELEGAIQDFITNQYEEVSFVIPNLQSQIPLIETSFKRYGIDLVLEDRNFLVIKKQFLSLLKYAHCPNEVNLLNIIELNVFNLKTYRELHFLIKTFGLIDSHLNTDIQEIITKCEEDRNTLFENLSRLSELSFIDAVKESYTLIFENQYSDLKPLKSYLEKSSRFYSFETIDLFTEAVESIPCPSFSHELIHIYDLHDFSIMPQEKVYALMLTAQNYPAINTNSGIFEESYLRRVPGYPTLEERTRHELESKSIFLRKSRDITLSYAIANYEGKPQTPSFAIENFANTTSVAWKLSENEYRKKQIKKLNPKIASELFTHNGIITTSVSALQLYTTNPYQYYVERGLKLREPEFPIFDARTLGTINHSVMENYHNKTSVPELWNAYTSPFETMIHKRDVELMEKNLKIIKDSQEVSVLETKYAELKFEKHPLFKKFKLTGIIDRVDVSDHHLMIVDYKSSATSLSTPKLLAGEQLQLLTYGHIASTLLNKKLFAVYNYGFNHSNINTHKYKYSAASGLSEVEDKIEDLFIKSQRYEGWIFDELNDLFTSDEYHKGIKELKSGLKVSPKPYVEETVMKVLENVYLSIYDNITSGVLDKNEIEIIDQSDIKLKEAFNDNTI